MPLNPEDLGELKTDLQGHVSFIPDLSKYAERAFQVEFSAEAFEKDSGRSVLGFTKLLVANAPYFLGWKSDGRLDYINHQAQRRIKLQAVNASLTAIELKQLNLKLEETRKVSA